MSSHTRSIQGSNHHTVRASYTEESISVSFEISDSATLGHIQHWQQAHQKMSKTTSYSLHVRFSASVYVQLLMDYSANAADLTDNTLTTRDVCKPGETISALKELTGQIRVLFVQLILSTHLVLKYFPLLSVERQSISREPLMHSVCSWLIEVAN